MMPPTQTDLDSRTLIDALLEEQRDLRPVERFARWKDANDQEAFAPAPHRILVPLTAPHPGEQYAFEVDLDRCSGCKSCVTACHALNGLDEEETWRSVGLLHGRGRHSFQQTITTACHHCLEPGCLEGCPVLAYEKEPLTGIVRHLDDQCIGCQYCLFMCPYEVPQYSKKRGIVRKCDMCHQRLSHGEAPACVQACPSEAIRITVTECETVRSTYRSDDSAPVGIKGEGFVMGASSPRPSPPEDPEEERGLCLSRSRGVEMHSSAPGPLSASKSPNPFLPCSPSPSITLPTTRYISARPLPADLLAGDAHEVRLQPAHAPLVWMLVLTQLSAGAFLLLPLIVRTVQLPLAVVGLTAGWLGLAGSFLHLGRPQKAWRSFLGLRRSWLSREIVAFGVFALLATATTLKTPVSRAVLWLPWVTALTGIFAVFCSGMVYHVTRRECWRGELSLGRFFGTTAGLGSATAWCATALSGTNSTMFAGMLVVTMVIKLARELAFLRRCPDDADCGDELPLDERERSAFLMRFRLGRVLRLRLACAWAGGVALPLLSLLPVSAPGMVAMAGALVCVAGELAERFLFFRAASFFKMPGSVRG